MAQDKGSKNLNVPPLRFPGFTDEWKRVKVSDLLDFYSTNSLSWDMLNYENGNILNLHYGLIHSGLPTLIDLKKDTLPFVNETAIPKRFTLCMEEDVAFADASEDTNDVAKAVEFINLYGKQVICGLHTIHGRDKGNKTVLGFKGYAFVSSAFHNQIRRLAQGTKIFSISSKTFDEVFIGIPNKDEQTKIARLLHLLDERIATQNKIIEDLKKLESAIIDLIIDNSDFPEIQFEELYDKAGEGGTPSTSISDYYSDGTIPFVKIEDLANKYLFGSKDQITELGLYKSSAWMIPANSIIFSNGATIGAISINKIPVCTKQGILGIIPKKDYDVEYLYYLMSSTYFCKQVEKIVTEGTMRTAYLKDINHIECPIPNLEKQKRISHIFSNISDKMEVEKTLRDQFSLQKNFLLMNMFI